MKSRELRLTYLADRLTVLRVAEGNGFASGSPVSRPDIQ